MNESSLYDDLRDTLERHAPAPFPICNFVVHTGGPTPFTCRNVRVRDAEDTIAEFARYQRGVAGSLGAFSVDVTSSEGERTVIPFSKVVMLRISKARP